MARPFGEYPQQHLRIAAEKQELCQVLEAVPDTRRRTIVLLTLPAVIDVLVAIEQLAQGQTAADCREIASLAHDALMVLRGKPQK